VGALERIRLRNSVQAIPTLARALRGGGNWLIEVKPPAALNLVDRVVELLTRANVRQWMVQSFDADNVRHVRANHPQAATAFLVEDAEVLKRAIGEGWPAVHLSHKLLTSDVCDGLRRAGSSIGVWTVNETPDIDRVLELGVDMIITDEPHRVRAATEAMRSGT
jgi:glycerophosphoryl diester phosphodiesterase